MWMREIGRLSKEAGLRPWAMCFTGPGPGICIPAWFWYDPGEFPAQERKPGRNRFPSPGFWELCQIRPGHGGWQPDPD